MSRLAHIAAAFVAVSVVATSCSGDSNIDDETIVAATVRVRADGCGPRTELGTGTSIGDGLVVTAAHVVAGANRVEVVDYLGATTAAQVVLFDPELDVAAVRPIAATMAAVPLRTNPAGAGDVGVVATASAEDAIELIDVEVMQRVTIRTTDIYRDAQVERPGLRVAFAVEPGDSGAMVHLVDGGVGIVWSRSTETSEQAWTVDLPMQLLESASRRALIEPIDTGPCP